jgi:hypothetical protein
MDFAMKQKIDAVLDRVKEPESGLSIRIISSELPISAPEIPNVFYLYSRNIIGILTISV